MLSKDSDPEVRASLAANSSVPLEILEQLVNDPDVNVRLSLAEEITLPPYILQKLCEDANPYVRDKAECTLEGVNFENQLKNEGFVHQSGNMARLGELLVDAGALTEEELEESLAVARQEELPLGRVLVKDNKVEAGLVIRALKLQSLVRKGKLTLESAEDKLTKAINQSQRKHTISREIPLP